MYRVTRQYMFDKENNNNNSNIMQANMNEFNYNEVAAIDGDGPKRQICGAFTLAYVVSTAQTLSRQHEIVVVLNFMHTHHSLTPYLPPSHQKKKHNFVYRLCVNMTI